MKKQDFAIHAPVFAGMRADLNQQLAEAVDMLRETGAEKATVTVKSMWLWKPVRWFLQTIPSARQRCR